MDFFRNQALGPIILAAIIGFNFGIAVLNWFSGNTYMLALNLGSGIFFLLCWIDITRMIRDFDRPRLNVVLRPEVGDGPR